MDADALERGDDVSRQFEIWLGVEQKHADDSNHKSEEILIQVPPPRRLPHEQLLALLFFASIFKTLSTITLYYCIYNSIY